MFSGIFAREGNAGVLYNTEDIRVGSGYVVKLRQQILFVKK